jgi:transposase
MMTNLEIDAAKARLEVHVLPSGAMRQVTNDVAGHAALVAWLQPQAPTLVVLEATGGYERAVAIALADAELRRRGRDRQRCPIHLRQLSRPAISPPRGSQTEFAPRQTQTPPSSGRA